MAKSSKSEKIEKVEESAAPIVVASDYDEFSGDGFSESTADDFVIPFQVLLQSNSKPVKKDTPAGAKAGLFLNSVTNKLSKHLQVIPVHSQRVFNEWKPQAAGGGFVASYPVGPKGELHPLVRQSIENNNGSLIRLKTVERYFDDVDGEKKLVKHEDPIGERREGVPSKRQPGNELVDTHNVFCLTYQYEGDRIVTDGFCVIAMTSKKIARRKAWWTAMMMVAKNAPYYAFPTIIIPTLEPDPRGDYFNLRALPGRGGSDPLNGTGDWSKRLDPKVDWELNLMREGKKFKEQITGGLAKVAPPPEADEPTAGSTASASEVDTDF